MKKVTKKILELLFISIFILSTVISSNAALFADVSAEKLVKYGNAINYVSDRGIMVGTSNYIFSPDTKINRAMLVQVLYKMSPDAGKPYSSTYADVASNAYYYNAVGWALSKGLMAGTGGNYFSPNVVPDNQQVLNVLYRYAKKYSDEYTIDCNVDFAVDYSRIFSYFIEGINWAYSYGIIKKNEDEPNADFYVSPRDEVDRQTFAKYIYLYRIHCEGIKSGRDNFSFSNSYSHFVSGAQNKYAIGSSERSLLQSYLTTFQWNTISGELDGKWHGSCYGMSISCALNSLGLINLNGNFATNTPSVFSIPKLTNYNNPKHQKIDCYGCSGVKMTKIESVINFYHMAKIASNLQEYNVHNLGNDNNYYAEKIINGQKFSGISLLYFYTPETSPGSTHCVIIFGKNKSTSNNIYKYNIYDPNYPSTESYLQLEKNGNNYTGKIYSGNGLKTITRFSYNKESEIISAFKNLDVDGAYNYIPNTSTNNINMEDKNIIRSVSNGDLTIENENGEEITISSTGVKSDLEIIYNHITINEKGQTEVVLIVPKNRNYSIVNNSLSKVSELYYINEEGCHEIY